MRWRLQLQRPLAAVPAELAERAIATTATVARQLGYVGRSFTLKQPIVNGRGKLTIEDTVWEIEGPDMEAGTRIKVTAVNDMMLVVEAQG